MKILNDYEMIVELAEVLDPGDKLIFFWEAYLKCRRKK